MSRDGVRLAEAAADLLGVRFRLHGRNPATGLDCVGLVACSLEAAGRTPDAPQGYRLRNSSISHWFHKAEASGLNRVDGDSVAGDVLLHCLRTGQHHLVIVESPGWVIHAHAGLGRIVHQPLDHSLVPLAHWRLAKTSKDK